MPRWLKIVVLVAVVLAAVVGGGVWFLHAGYFQSRMAQVAAQQIEHASGLRARFGRFRLSYRPLSANLYDVTIRGREPANGPPLAFLPHIYVRLRIASLRPVAVRITELDLDQPRIHIYKLPDGDWNLPKPPAVEMPPAKPIFDLGLERLRLSQGTLRLGDRTIPLEATLAGVRVQLRRTDPETFAGVFAFARGRLAGPLPRALEQSARVAFTLKPDAVGIGALTWSAAGSRLEAHGRIDDLAAPRAAFEYRASVDLAAWGRLEPRLGLPAGHVTLAGEARWTATGWAAKGNFAAEGVRMRGADAAIGALAGSGSFAADRRGLRLPEVKFSGLGGSGEGSVELSGYRLARVTTRLRGFQLARLLRLAARIGVAPAGLPPLAGTLAARVTAQFDVQARRRWRARGTVTVAPPQGTARAPLPLPVAAAIEFAASPASWQVRVNPLRIVTPALTLAASGTTSSAGNTNLQVAVASEDLGAWQAVLARYLPSAPGSLGRPRLAGKLRIEATLAGTPHQPIAHAAVSLANFRYGAVAADELDAIATVAPSTARLGSLHWRWGGQTFTAAGEIGLTEYRPTAASPLHFSVEGQELAIAELEKWAGLSWPIAGQLNLTLAVGGTAAAPEASGEARLAGARLWGQAVASATARLAATETTLTIANFAAVAAGGRITGTAAYDWKAGTYRFAAQTAALELRQIAVLQSSRLALSGQLSGHVESQGTRERPQGNASLDAIDLRGGGESLGTLHLEVHADGTTAHLAAALGLPNGRLTLAGAIGESHPYGLDAQAQLTDYDIDVWLRRFTQAQLTGHSRISGTITVQGPLSRPADLVAQASFDPIHLSLESVVVRNAGPVRVGLTHDLLTLAPARMVGADTDFSFAGEVQLSTGAIHGTARGQVNLAIIHALHPTTHSAGELSLDAQLGGALRAPTITGELRVTQASLAEEDLPVAFEHIEGTLRFSGNRVEIAHLTAETGGGEISIAGSAARTAGGFVVNLQATGTNLRIRYQGVSATSDLRLQLSGQRGTALLSGQVELTRMGVAPNFDFALFLANRHASAPSLTSNTFLDKIHLDVHLVTGPQVEVATGAARLQFQADLRVRGTLANPVLLGRVSVAAGEIRFAGNEYTVSKGDITFANPFRIQPVIDFGLTTTVQQYDITLNISGPVDKLNITYRSDPPLSSQNIVALLATGQTQESPAAVNQESTNAFVGQSEQLLGLALDNLFQSRLQRMFGVTQIQVNPNATGLLGTGQATVTVEQQVSRNLKVTYTQNLATSSQDIVQVEWTINRDFGITVSRDQFGLYGISLDFRHRAR